MKTHLTVLLLFWSTSALFADWDYQYLTLDELIRQSSLIATAEIKEIEEKKKKSEVEQSVIFAANTVLKGSVEEKRIHYHASHIPVMEEPGVSYFIESAPQRKFLLFLKEEKNVFHATRGPISVLEIREEDGVPWVYWYTDASEPQKFSVHWKPKPLKEVLSTIMERQNLLK